MGDARPVQDESNNMVVNGVGDEELRLVLGLYRAIGGETELLGEVLASEWEDIPSIPDQPAGPNGLLPHIVEFRTKFADAQVVVHEILGAGGRVAVRAELTGIHVGEFFGVPPTGEQASIVIHEFHEIAQGRIARSWHLEDLYGWTAPLRA